MGAGFDVRYLPPAAVADGLAAGELDVGLVPVIELQRIPGLVPLAGPCVAASSEVRSVLLISKRPVEEIRTVSLDENSRTSALRVDRRRYLVLDLAAEWRRLTGHPFVFALWAARQGLPRVGLARPFLDSLRLAESEMPRLIELAAAETGLARGEIESYLTRNLVFRLGAKERAGLEEFHQRAFAHGLVPELRPLEFWRA